VLRENRRRSAAEIQKEILLAVTNFSSGPWQDDATLLVVGVN